MFPIYIIPLIVLLVSTPTRQLEPADRCNFEDTVDLTNAHRFQNGSYLYENIIIPANQVHIYEYVESNELEHIEHVPHPRGCLCHERNCIQFCCHPTKEVLSYKGQCVPLRNELSYDALVNVLLKTGYTAKRNAFKYFTVVQRLPCDYAYPLFPEINKEDEWNMFENGSMLLRHGHIVLTKNDYCLTPSLVDDDRWKLLAMNCPVRNTIGETDRIFNIGML